MSESELVALPGSARNALSGVEVVEAVDPNERITVTLVLRRREELSPEVVDGPSTLNRAELAERNGADPADVQAVRDTLTAAGLEISGTDAASRRVIVSGTAERLTRTFGTELNTVRTTDAEGGTFQHRARTGELKIPAALDGIVLAVLGLDNRRQAQAYARRLGAHAEAAARTSYRPDALAKVYKFPDGTDGSGTTIAILELGGGFAQSELDTYFSGLGIKGPQVKAVGVDGGKNTPAGDPNSADGEVLLDIEVAGALAPGANQVVYFAPNTDRGFHDALSTAVHADPTPAAISISWGGPEDQWTTQARKSFDAALADAAALGVTVTCASGDNGSGDGENSGVHTDFPASSPHALACGGTNLQADANGAVSAETVWNDGNGGGATGGGISTSFPVPDYQKTAGVPKLKSGKAGRGVPDVAAVADPASGYQVLVDGQQLVFGGTSAVAPLWAALIARLTQALNRPMGLLQTQLYAGAKAGHVQPGFRDVTEGSNGAYKAAAGWDPCTGLGVPDGEALLTALKSSS